MSITDDNVVPLETAAIKADLARAKAGLEKAAAGREEWIDGMVSAATRIAAKRAQLGADQAFGAWWDAQGFGLDKNDRAALVTMGAKPEIMREVLAAEPRRTSMQEIYATHRERFPEQVRKPREHKPAERKPAEPKVQRRIDPDADRPVEKKAREIARARMDAGLDVNPRKLETDTGISHVMFDQAIAQERAIDEAKRDWVENPPIDPATLSLTAQQKLEAAKRHLEKEAERTLAARQARFDEEVRLKVLAKTADRLAMLRERQAEAIAERDRYNELRNQFKPIYTEAEWEVLFRVCHPDNTASEEKRNHAFRLIRDKKLQLTKMKL